MVGIPLAYVLAALFSPADDAWNHIWETTLLATTLNTLWLALGVAFLTFFLGTSLAWLTARCEFPGRSLFDWALMLPLAFPAYVIAFVSIGLLEFAGPIQTLLRNWWGGDIWFPAIRSRGGVIVVMSLVLYPYVYFLARNAFLSQDQRTLEVARSLGYTPSQIFFKLSLPLARPWLVGGVMLVVMEVLADFGAVYIFGYDTLSTAIYKAWYGHFSLTAASKIASLLVLIVFVLLLLEQRSRLQRRYIRTSRGRGQRPRRIPLKGKGKWLATGYGFFVLFLAFVIPCGQLLIWAAGTFGEEFNRQYWNLLTKSFFLGGIAAFFTVLLALLLSYARRVQKGLLTRLLARVATLGYALPGTMLAVGVFLFFSSLDSHLLAWSKDLFGYPILPFLSGTLLVVLTAYQIRFLAVAYSPIDSSMERISPRLDEAGRSLGRSRWGLLWSVHFPLLRGGIFTGMALVWVDVIKEMPLTLMTRPFGWDTLSVRIFNLTSEGQWERASLSALAMVMAGLVPLLFFTKTSIVKKGSEL